MFTATIRSTVSILWTPSPAAVQEFPLDGKGIPIPTINYQLDAMRRNIGYREDNNADPDWAVFADPRMRLIFSSYEYAFGLAYLFDQGKVQRVPDWVISQHKKAFHAWRGEPHFAIDPLVDLAAEARQLTQFRSKHLKRLRGQTKVETL